MYNDGLFVPWTDRTITGWTTGTIRVVSF